MSVNIVQNGELLPIAGKTVPAPTPDYVDEQYSSSTTYSKGMTCISGNKRYRYINSTASSGHQPPNATYWEVLSVSDQLEGGSYSTSEIDTGNTWIDGKRVYKKTYTFAGDTLSPGGTDYPDYNYFKRIITSDFDRRNIVKFEGFVQINTSTQAQSFLPIPEKTATGNMDVGMFVYSNQITVLIKHDSPSIFALADTNYYLTFYYTK